MKSKNYTRAYKRKLEHKTNYARRLKLLKSNKPRLVIRKSLNNIIVQAIKYQPKGDIILASAHSNYLKKLGWKYHLGNIPSAYLTGLLCGVKLKEKNVNEVVLDIGFSPSIKGSAIYAALKGVLDSGINVPHDKTILPSQDQITGKIILRLAMEFKKKDLYNQQFSGYIKNKVNLENINQEVEELKTNILKK